LQTEPNQIHSEPNPSFFKNRTETEQKLKNLFRTSLAKGSSTLCTNVGFQSWSRSWAVSLQVTEAKHLR